MSNIMKELKSEITRLARKEAIAIVEPIRKVNAAQRSLIAGLRRQIDAMQKELNGLKKSVSAPVTAIQATDAPKGRFWITGNGVKALRTRLGLTQAQFGKLAGVSVPTVIKWEGAKGKAPIRLKAAIARLQAIRKMGKKQAEEILGTGTAGGGKVKSRAKRRAKKA